VQILLVVIGDPSLQGVDECHGTPPLPEPTTLAEYVELQEGAA
jgi:hypothetical protein